MKVFAYSYQNSKSHSQEEVSSLLQAYIAGLGAKSVEAISAKTPLKLTWRKREIGQVLREVASSGDVLVAYEAMDMASSMVQFLDILMQAARAGVEIHLVRYNEIFRPTKTSRLSDLLRLTQNIESEFFAVRASEEFVIRKVGDATLGRPRGRKNSNLKLDKMRKEILHYMELGLSKTSIARLIQCHPQTLYGWIDRHSVPDSKPRRRRVRVAAGEVATMD